MRIRSALAATLLFAAAATAQEAVSPSPISLDAAVSEALQQVSPLQQAQLDEKSAEEDLRQARAALLPRVRDAFSVTYNSREPGSDPPVPSFVAANAIHEYQNLVGVAGEWNFTLLAAIRHDRALLDAARAGTEVARRALRRGVSEAYYGAALARAKRDAAEQSFSAAEEFERVTRLNFEAGEIPEVDLIRARLQTEARRDDVANARQSALVANAQLSTLLGRPLDVAPVIDALPQSVDIATIGTLTAAGVQRRPELAQADAQFRAARADVGAARAALLPTITYSVDRGFDAETLAIDERHRHRGTLAMATIDVPLFDWGITLSKMRQAQLHTRAADLQRQLVTRDLNLQFVTAQQEASTATERIDNARRALADAERNVDISIARYRAGEAPISEATDAQTARAQQRVALQQALYDFQVAVAHLREAAGE